MEQNECLFCKIIRQEIPSFKIFEDETVYAFLDIFPSNDYHTLVIPKAHSENIFEISENDLKAINATAKKIAEKMKQELGIDNLNIFQSNGKNAEQVIQHYHMHIIPRYENDGIKFHQKQLQKTPEEFKELQEKLKL